MANYWFISTQNRNKSLFACITFALAFIVILLGAYTRLTDAGLSCPDWPHCYGYLTAPHTTSQLQGAAEAFPQSPVNVKKAWTEMTHRYFAGFEGILILVLAYAFFTVRKSKGLKATIIPIALITLLGVQVMLGMLTVTEKLKPIIVLAHLMIGLSLLTLLWWTFLELYSRQNSYLPVSLKPWLWFGLAIVAMQITLGGWVSTHYAGLACIDLPYCNGKLLPTLQWNNLDSDLITIHMLHRIGAIITAIYLAILCKFLFAHTQFRLLAAWILILITLQLTLGILNILWLRPVWIALTHHAVAILLFLSVITALQKATFITEYRYATYTA